MGVDYSMLVMRVGHLAVTFVEGKQKNGCTPFYSNNMSKFCTIINKKSIIDKELKRKFTPEFINRIDQIVYFNSLTDDNLKNIVKLEINKFNNRLNNIEYNIEYTDDVVNYIHAEAIKKKELGARPIIRLIQTNIEDKITELMLTNDYKPKYVFHASCESDEIVIK